jgi:hypothetical protein
MSTIPKSEDSSILYRISFDLLPSPKIDSAIKRDFDEVLGNSHWILLQDGSLSRNQGADFYPKRIFFVSAEHKPTLASLHFLKEVISGKTGDERIHNWSIKVGLSKNEQNDSEEDFIICFRKKFYLRKMKKAWDAMSSDYSKLLEEIQKEQG